MDFLEVDHSIDYLTVYWEIYIKKDAANIKS